MNYIKKNYQLLIVTISFLFYSCANMISPSGGLKDIDPPKLLKSKPQNNSNNTNTRSIELVFDEYINLKDIQNQFIISPSNIEAEIKKDGKKLKIELSAKPSENTTYILNFGDAISDYTEGNVAKDFKFIFSTGNEIDSLSLSGNILDAFTLDAVKDVIVCLYSDSLNDSVVYKKKPDYTVRTDQDGKFRFTNLKNNKYKFFAIKEENNNKIFDTQEEQIAFIDTLINLSENKQIQNIKLFKEEAKKRKLLSKEITYQKVELIFNKENNIELINLHSKIDTVIYSNKKDTIAVYYTENADSTSLFLSENSIIDTVKIKFPKNLKRRELNITADSKIKNNSVTISTYDLFDINKKDSIILYEDSTKVLYNIEKIKYNKYLVQYPFNPEKKYNLYIADSSFVSFQKMYSKKISNNLTFTNPEDYGNLSIKATPNPLIIYELLNEKNEVIDRTKNSTGIIKHEMLAPGTYRLRMVYDSNNNNKWDTGKYDSKNQPEKVEYYTNPIKIRANWDLEIELIP
jgi:uncharacterized protein (DUF2141 family)